MYEHFLREEIERKMQQNVLPRICRVYVARSAGIILPIIQYCCSNCDV